MFENNALAFPKLRDAFAETCPFRGVFRFHYGPHLLRQVTDSCLGGDGMESARRVPCPRANMKIRGLAGNCYRPGTAASLAQVSRQRHALPDSRGEHLPAPQTNLLAEVEGPGG
jgi:hypothetical protein